MPSARTYGQVTDALSDIRHDYIVDGMKAREVYAKYWPLCGKPFTLGSIHVLMSRAGMPRERRVLEKERRTLRPTRRHQLQRSVEKRDGAAQSAEVRKAAIDREREAQARHTERMTREHDWAFTAIAETEVTQGIVGKFLGNLDTFDRLGRRIFNIRDDEPLTSHRFNVAVLLNADKLEAKG